MTMMMILGIFESFLVDLFGGCDVMRVMMTMTWWIFYSSLVDHLGGCDAMRVMTWWIFGSSLVNLLGGSSFFDDQVDFSRNVLQDVDW